MSSVELPAGWSEVELGDVADIKSGITLGKKRSPDQELIKRPYLRVANVQRGNLDLSVIKTIDVTEEEAEALRLEAGDILMNEGGDRDKLGRGWIWSGEIPNCIFQNHVFRVRLRAHQIQPKYISLYANEIGRHFFQQQGKQSVNLASINQTTVAKLPIPLPPLPEQHRIVEKIEVLTARSRRAREALDTLPALIDRYRQSILAAAFRGDLTADWRNSGVRSDGELPVGWCWRTVAEIVQDGPTNGYSPKAAPDGNGTASLRLSATTSGRLVLDDTTIKRLIETIPVESKFWLKTGDVLIQRANSIDYLGATAVFNGAEKSYIYPDLMMRVRIADAWLRAYFCRYMNGHVARQWLRERATGTAGNMPKISGATLKALPVPVPPPSECVVINQRLDRAFAAIDRIQRIYNDGRHRLATLDQSILAKAFRGELVPQDPNDEPASVLLERIRAERAAAGAAPRRGRRGGGKASA